MDIKGYYKKKKTNPFGEGTVLCQEIYDPGNDLKVWLDVWPELMHAKC